MSNREINIKKIIAFVLLVLEVIAILFVGFLRAENEGIHYGTIYEPHDSLYLTFSKDVALDDSDGETIAPKGSRVLVFAIGYNYVGGYYSKTDSGFDDFMKLDSLEQIENSREMGFLWFHLSWDCFEEQTKLQELYREKELAVEAKREAAMTEIYCYTAFSAILCILAGALLIFLLSRKEWYLLLYVLEVIALIITIFILPSVFLY